MSFFHFLLSLHLASQADTMRCMVTIGLAMVRWVTMTIGFALVFVSFVSFGHGVVWVVTLGLTMILSLGLSHVVVWVVGKGLAMLVSLAVGYPIA